MGGQSSGRQTITTDDWMRRIEKRLMHEERRPQIRTASDLMGPGLGPKAVQLFDWNDDITLFNGFFWSEPGPAQHSPDNTKHWMGYNVVNLNGNGYQRVYEYRDATDTSTVATWVRRFRTPPGLSRVFEAWVQATGSGGGGGGAVPLVGCKITATADQACANLGVPVVAFGSTVYDTSGMADLANNRIVIKKAGYYRINSHIVWASNATGYRATVVRVNGLSIADNYYAAANGNVTVSGWTTEPILLAIGDLVNVFVVQSSGATVNLTIANSRYSHLEVDWVADAVPPTPVPTSRYGSTGVQATIIANALQTFSPAFAAVPDTNYAVIFNMNSVDCVATVTAKTTTGCSVTVRNKDTAAARDPGFTWMVVHGGA